MNPLQWVTAIVYAAVRGAVQAYLDVMQERATAIEEMPDNEDRARARRIHDAIAGLPVSTTGAGSARPNDTTPGVTNGQRPDMGKAT